VIAFLFCNQLVKHPIGLSCFGMERKGLVIVRCMHGLIEGQCSICVNLREKLQPEKLQTEKEKPSNRKAKKAKG
jgi:hypothetical protein